MNRVVSRIGRTTPSTWVARVTLLTLAALGMLVTLGTNGCGSTETPAESDPDAATDAPTNVAPDTGTPEQDAAADAALDAPEVTIQYGNCASFTACGGTVSGHFTLAGGCVREETLDPARKSCPNFKEHDVVIKGKGVVDVTATTITRNVEVSLSGSLDIPKSCSAPLNNCAAIALALKTPQAGAFDTASCSDAPNDFCACTATKKLVTKTTANYTQTGNTVKLDSNETLDVCVEGNKLTYEDTTPSRALAATFSLTK